MLPQWQIYNCEKLSLLSITPLAQSRYLHRWGPHRPPDLQQSSSHHKYHPPILRPPRCFGITQLRICFPLNLLLGCVKVKRQNFDRRYIFRKFPGEFSYRSRPIAAWSVIFGTAIRVLLLQKNYFGRPPTWRQNSALKWSYSQWICLLSGCWRHIGLFDFRAWVMKRQIVQS